MDTNQVVVLSVTLQEVIIFDMMKHTSEDHMQQSGKEQRLGGPTAPAE